MELDIWGASTLKTFTDSIRSGFLQLGLEPADRRPTNLTFIQIHGAPSAQYEDEKIIEKARALSSPKVFLIHRPDEVLLNSLIRSYFESNPRTKLIFLGDLIFRFPFWANRRAFSSVIPHPHLDFSMPAKTTKPIVGAFTSWGEMRDVRHYFSLVERLAKTEAFEFQIGGQGIEETKMPQNIQYSREPFVPHFNVQLYHLRGKKRYGESSGSLHRGISIPIIFEANGAERLEGFKAVKIKADDDFESIEFDIAATEILKIANTDGIDPILEANRHAAQNNSVSAFANAVKRVVEAS
jgi:hypothetical protein